MIYCFASDGVNLFTRSNIMAKFEGTWKYISRSNNEKILELMGKFLRDKWQI